MAVQTNVTIFCFFPPTMLGFVFRLNCTGHIKGGESSGIISWSQFFYTTTTRHFNRGCMFFISAVSWSRKDEHTCRKNYVKLAKRKKHLKDITQNLSIWTGALFVFCVFVVFCFATFHFCDIVTKR